MGSTRVLRLPDFIGVGPPRTGTTWLDRLLRGRVGLPSGVKETQFFSWRYELGLEWYAWHFQSAASQPAGEFSPLYFASASARERIAQHIPQCKIICTLREPVARLYSHYRLWRRIGAVKGGFEEVSSTHRGLLSYTEYAANVSAWRRRFGVDNVLVAIYEDARVNRQGYVDRICDFIGVPRFELASIVGEAEPALAADFMPRSRRLAFTAIRLRALLDRHRWYRTADRCMPLVALMMGGGGKFPPLAPELEQRLRRRFKPEVERMEELLQRALPDWRVDGTCEIAPSKQATG